MSTCQICMLTCLSGEKRSPFFLVKIKSSENHAIFTRCFLQFVELCFHFACTSGYLYSPISSLDKGLSYSFHFLGTQLLLVLPTILFYPQCISALGKANTLVHWTGILILDTLIRCIIDLWSCIYVYMYIWILKFWVLKSHICSLVDKLFM